MNAAFSGNVLLQVDKVGNSILRITFTDGTGIQILAPYMVVSYINHAAVMEKLAALQQEELKQQIVDYTP